MIKIEKYSENKIKRITAIKILPILILIAICSLGIGYASINSINLNIVGNLGASAPKTIFITKVVDQSENPIEGFYNGTILNSTVELDSDDITSTKTYKITVYNNTTQLYKYESTVCDTTNTEFYSNGDIIYTLTNIAEDDEILPGESKTFNIEFKYNENVLAITNNILNSCIKFVFKDSINRIDISNWGNGVKFASENIEFNANNETIYAEMNIENIPESPLKENILSIGQEISEWRTSNTIQGGVNLHMFYPDSNGKIIISPTIQGQTIIQFTKAYSKIKDDGIIKIAFNSNGLYINGEKIIDGTEVGYGTAVYDKQNQMTVEEYLQMFFNKWKSGNLTINIGSQEGVNRSWAKYNAVEIYKVLKTETEMIELTKISEPRRLEDIVYTDFLPMEYKPQGEKFTFDMNNEYNNFSLQTLYTEIDISNITRAGSKENIISIGHEIAEWSPLENNKANIHFYYPNDDGTLIIAFVLNGRGHKQWKVPKEDLNASNGILKIAFNLNGIFINGINIISNEGANPILDCFASTTSSLTEINHIQETLSRLCEGKLQVGSQQGDSRSNADYYKLRVYEDVVTYEDMVRLTTP